MTEEHSESAVPDLEQFKKIALFCMNKIKNLEQRVSDSLEEMANRLRY